MSFGNPTTRKVYCLLTLSLIALSQVALAMNTWLPYMTAHAQKYGGTMVVAHWEDPLSMNPDAQIDDAGAALHRVIYNWLVTFDYDYNIIPDLAYDWDVSEDGKTYTFYLYENVTWHDGVPFTSADVKWTFDAIKEFHGVAYTDIKCDNILSIETPDDYTVVFHLAEPYAPFLGFLAWYGTHIMPKHIWEPYVAQNISWLDPSIEELEKPVGTGPFKLEEWKRADHITLVANEDYFKGRPYLDKIIYRIIPDPMVATQALYAGEVDLLHHRPPLEEIKVINATEGLIATVEPSLSRWYIGFNLAKSPFDDVRVRRAIAYAINRTEVVEKAMAGYGFPAEGCYIPGIAWAYNPDAKLPPYDPVKAEELLNESGYLRGPDGIRFTMTYTCWTGAEEVDIGQVIMDNLREVGIEVLLTSLEFHVWIDRVTVKKDFDIALCDGWQGPDPANLKIRVGAGEVVNFAGYENSEVERLLAEGDVEVDLEKRKEIYFRIQEILAEDLPYIWLADLTSFYIHKTKFHGFPWSEARGKAGFNVYTYVWIEEAPAPAPAIGITTVAAIVVVVGAAAVVAVYFVRKRGKTG